MNFFERFNNKNFSNLYQKHNLISYLIITLIFLLDRISKIKIIGYQQKNNLIYINDFIANSDVKAFKDIKDRHSQLDNSVPDKTVHTTCPDCQHKYVIPFTFDHANFFALAS